MSTQTHDILPSISSSFESEDDPTSCSSSEKINFDPTLIKNHVFFVISDLESVNSTDCEDSFHEYKLEECNLSVEFEPFVMSRTEDTIFKHDLTSSYFVKDIIETSS